MLISFIIISKCIEDIQINLEELKQSFEINQINAEIILAFGINPSIQRNKSAIIAKGEWLYFLDDDSIMDSQTINQLLLTIKKFPDADVVGGPSVLPQPAGNWQKAVQLVFSSDIGVGPLKSRYHSNGLIRESNEKEIILCNMVIKKKIFNEMNGFNENLFPNEENEFLSRLSEKVKIIYSPLMIVYREHRNGPIELLSQMIRYGKGRTRHLLFSNEYTDYIYFLPLLLLLIFSAATILKIFHGPLTFIAFFYFILVLTQSIFFSFYHKSISFMGKAVLAYLVCHTGYAVGLFLGFFDQKKRIVGEVRIVEYLSPTQAS